MIDTFPGIEAELLQLFRDPAGFAAGNRSVAGRDELLAAAERHGVAALLAARCADAPPSPLLERLRDSARGSAAWEMGHRRAVLDALSALAAAGITAVLFKGTALAYSLYPNPVLRTRGDTDLIVPQHQRERVTGALLRCGFAPLSAAECATVSYQTSFRRSRPEGSHVLDVHWKINNSEVLSQLFSYQELRDEAVSLPGLDSRGLRIPLRIPGLPDNEDIEVLGPGFPLTAGDASSLGPPPRHGEHTAEIRAWLDDAAANGQSAKKQ